MNRFCISKSLGYVAGVVSLCTLAGCDPNNNPSLQEVLLNGNANVVSARMYQKGDWMLDRNPVGGIEGSGGINECTATEPAECIKCVCDALKALSPHYVSGLIRLGWEPTMSGVTPLTESQIAIYKGVKECVTADVQARLNRPVRFDVVLNAKDYTADGDCACEECDNKPQETCEPNQDYRAKCKTEGKFEGVSNKQEGLTRLKQAVTEAKKLDPDGFLFDFYSTPWKNKTCTYHKDALEEGIAYIRDESQHGNKRYFVGGNVFPRGKDWEFNIPDGTAFVAVTDQGGRENVERKVETLDGKKVPILMHIRNDPHILKSSGVRWVTGNFKGDLVNEYEEVDGKYRRSILQRHFRWQKDFGYTYMYPVFFPLAQKLCTDGMKAIECEKCTGPGCMVVQGARAYDATLDGDMLQGMAVFLDQNATAQSKQDVLAKFANKSPYDVQDDDFVTIHRAFNDKTQHHIYSKVYSEFEEGKHLTIDEDYFSLGRDATPDTTPFYRCNLGVDGYLLTTSPTCEGAPNAINEGLLGHIAPTQLAETVPLFRLFRKGMPQAQQLPAEPAVVPHPHHGSSVSGTRPVI